jgi:hypothetical protein
MMESDFLPRTVSLFHEAWPTAASLAELFASTAGISDAVKRWVRGSASVKGGGVWLIIVLAIALLWLVLYLWARSRKPRSQAGTDREGLFAQLCDLHKLSKSDRQLLRSVAKAQRIDQPALAFVNPNLLLKYVEASPRATLDALELADRLFGRALVEEIVNQSAAERV